MTGKRTVDVTPYLDELEAGLAPKKIAAQHGLTLDTLSKRIADERRRRGAKTTYQLVAMHAKGKWRG